MSKENNIIKYVQYVKKYMEIEKEQSYVLSVVKKDVKNVINMVYLTINIVIIANTVNKFEDLNRSSNNKFNNIF